MLGSRAIYHDGWKATTDHVGGQLAVERENIEGSRDFDEDHWLLFDLDDDFSESRDVAAEHPDRVQQLIDAVVGRGGRNQVLPLDDSFIGRAGAMCRPAYGPGSAPCSSRVAGPCPRTCCRRSVPGYVVTARRRGRRAAPKGSCSRSATGPTAARGTCSTARPCTCSTFSATRTASSRPNVFPRARTICRTRIPRGRWPHGDPRDRRSRGRTGRAPARPALPVADRQRRAARSVRTAASPCATTTAVPFRFSGTLHDVTFAIPMLAPKDDTAAHAELGIALKGE